MECVEGSLEMRKSATADLRWLAAIVRQDARERAFGHVKTRVNALLERVKKRENAF